MAEPEISITIKVSGIQQATELLQKLAEAMKPAAAATFTTTSNDLMISAPETKKRRKYQRKAGKADPYELIKKGWVVRGPYAHGKTASELVITNPAKMWKEKVSYSVGDNAQLNQHDVLKLKALAEHNEKNVKDGRKTQCEKRPPVKDQNVKQEDRPDPFELVKPGWIVKGPWKEGGKDNPYMAIHVYSPDKKQRFKYVVGSTKAGYQGLTDKDVNRLKMQAAVAKLKLPPGSDPIPEVTIKPGEEIHSEPLKELPKNNKSSACQLCLNRGRPLGKCEKMGAPHCKICHDASHGDLIYPFKVV